MKFGKRDKSIVDALFLLALFGVFLICALFIVLFGAKIYKNTIENSENSFLKRTYYTYITEKIRQNDNEKGIEIETSDGSSTVILSKTVNGKDYITYLYCDEGFLKEYTTSAGNELKKQSGNEIVELTCMNVTECNPNLYHFILEGLDTKSDFYVSITSDTGGALNE